MCGFEKFEQFALNAEAADIFGGTGAREDSVVLSAGDLVEFVEADDADLSERDGVFGGIDQAGKDRIDVLADVSRFRVVGDIDESGGEFKDVAEKQFDQVCFAASCGSDQEVVGLGGELLDGDSVEMDGTDTLDVSVSHEGHSAAGVVLSDIAELSEFIEYLARGEAREILDDIGDIFVGLVAVEIHVHEQMASTSSQFAVNIRCGK